jgi:hypothetical protein
MDIVQFVTLMATMIGCMFSFYQMTKQEISVIREQINKMNDNHREDIQNMDNKWERLFEKLLVGNK